MQLAETTELVVREGDEVVREGAICARLQPVKPNAGPETLEAASGLWAAPGVDGIDGDRVPTKPPDHEARRRERLEAPFYLGEVRSEARGDQCVRFVPSSAPPGSGAPPSPMGCARADLTAKLIANGGRRLPRTGAHPDCVLGFNGMR